MIPSLNFTSNVKAVKYNIISDFPDSNGFRADWILDTNIIHIQKLFFSQELEKELKTHKKISFEVDLKLLIYEKLPKFFYQ